ncbi:MAG: outer membrane beta-barrel protein, partial [Sphingomonadales bacterium]|nr:outer membrane beta-barrel protein [Sphingomonadales bacterium]
NPAFADDGSSAYVGVSAGYGWSTADVTTSTVFDAAGYFASTSVPSINADGVQRIKPKAFNGGIDVGYDYRTSGVVIGLAADISTLDNSRTAIVTTIYPCCAPTTYTVAQTVKTKWMTTIRAKLGVDAGPADIYVTGGWAGEKVRYSAQFTDTFATASESASADKFRSGWVVGGGADIRVGGNWSIQPEFLHSEFGTMTVAGSTLTAFTPSQSFPTNVFTHTMKLRTDVARVGVHYHF